jgi:hypothetical protein
MKPPEEQYHEALAEALFWDNLIQNNMVRARPQDIDKMLPGVIFSLIGLWEGRNKYTQEVTKKGLEPKTNATRKR